MAMQNTDLEFSFMSTASVACACAVAMHVQYVLFA